VPIASSCYGTVEPTNLIIIHVGKAVESETVGPTTVLLVLNLMRHVVFNMDSNTFWAIMLAYLYVLYY